MSLDMMDVIDQTFATGKVTLTAPGGGYVRGEFSPAAGQPVEYLATKQVASSEELRHLEPTHGGVRYTDVARFFLQIAGKPVPSGVNAILTDQHGKKYKIIDADIRPERNYCKLLGASINE